MDSTEPRSLSVLWSFWLATGLTVTGGIAPLLLAAGGPNRIAGVIVPFAVAAGAMGANAMLYRRGRQLVTVLYFLAGVAIVYGLLMMLSVPLRLAVVGTCPATPAICPAGFERPFSDGESSGFGIALVMGSLAIMSGFYGLLMIYRRRPPGAAKPPSRRPEMTPVVATETADETPTATPPEAPPETPPETPPPTSTA